MAKIADKVAEMLLAMAQQIGTDVRNILARLDRLEQNSGGGTVTVSDRVLVYRRTQRFDFINPENNSFAWSGQQIRYEFDVPQEFVGKFCEVFINGNVDARVPAMTPTLTLFSQNPTDKDEILIVAYVDSEHVDTTLYAHGL